MIRRLFPLSVLCFALAANAQSGVSFAPVASFDFGSPLFINRTQGVLNAFGIPSAGNSSSESYGIGIHAAIPDLIGRIGLMGQLEGVYTAGKFTFTSQPYSVSGIDRKLLLELGALWDAKPFAIRAGPWISQAISRNVYENDPNGVQVASGDSTASASTHVGLSAGIAWQIPDFPIHPELNAHLDLTALSQAGSNAWSVGISLSYSFNGGVARASARSQAIDSERRAEARATSVLAIIPRTRFLVNGVEANGNPPLERLETRVKQYAMIDSANTPPRVTQWVEESYRLPHLSLSCKFDRHSAGYLMILKDSLRLMEKYFEGIPNANTASDTTIDLENDVAWNAVLNHLNTGESNRLIAELRTNHEQLSLSSDTLVLPPADTSRAAKTITKKQFRFVLSDNFNDFEGGEESLDLLLNKIKSLLGSNVNTTIIESPNSKSIAAHSAILRRLHDTLGDAWASVRHEKSTEKADEITVVLEY